MLNLNKYTKTKPKPIGGEKRPEGPLIPRGFPLQQMEEKTNG